MATLISTISLTNGYSLGSGIDSNGNHYFVAYINTGANTSDSLVVYKSTNDGVDWTEMDSSNRPSGFTLAQKSYAMQFYAVDVGKNRIAIAYSVSNAYVGNAEVIDYFVAIFNMSSYTSKADQWETLYNVNDLFCEDDLLGYPFIHHIMPSVRDSNDVVCIYEGAVQISTEYYSRVYYLKIVGSTMTSGVKVDDFTSSETVSAYIRSISSDAGNNTWVVWGKYNTTITYWVTLNSSYTKGTTANSTNSDVYFARSDGQDGADVRWGCTSLNTECFHDGSAYKLMWFLPYTNNAFTGTTQGVIIFTTTSYTTETISTGWPSIKARTIFGFYNNTGDGSETVIFNRYEGDDYIATRTSAGSWSVMDTGSGISSSDVETSYPSLRAALKSNEYYLIQHLKYFKIIPGMILSTTAVSFKLATVAPTVIWVSEIAIPCQDVSLNGWNSIQGTSNIYSYIDENSVNNADFVVSDTSASTYRVKLSPLSTPSDLTGWYLSYSYFKEGVINRICNLKVRLCTSSTTIVEYTHTDVSTTITTANQSLNGQLGSVSDWGDLFLEFEVVYP